MPSHTVFFGRKSVCRAHSRSGELFGILQHGKFLFLFSYSVNHLYTWALKNFIFNFRLKFSTILFILLLKLFQFWLLGTLQVGSCVPLTYLQHSGCFSLFLTFWQYKVLWIHLVYILTQSQNQLFSKQLSFILLENSIRNLDLDPKHTHCYWVSFLLGLLN